MTQCQKDNLQEIISVFIAEMPPKYRRGIKDHGDGCLAELSALALCESALEEALDQVAYLATLRHKLRRMK